MPTNVIVPSLGESVSEAVLLRWLKNEGEVIEKDEPLVELETDKANVDLPAPATGVVRRAKEVGETVMIGETIARIDDATAAAPPAKAAPAAAAAGAGETSAPQSSGLQTATAAPPAAPPLDRPEELSPAVRRLAEENHLDAAALASIPASGPGGRITKDDVVRHLNRANRQPPTDGANGKETMPPPAPASAPVQPSVATTPKPLPPGAGAGSSSAMDFGPDGVKRVPMSKIRKRIAQNLILAQQTAAILTTFNEIDLTNVIAIRAKFKERFQEVHGVGLGFMSFFARATALALKEFPRVNAFLEGDDLVYHNYVHLGIAVSTDRGLTVPVLRNAEQMSFAKIESEIKRLAGAARDGKLGLQELSGGTFTITNGGIFGSLLSTPILNPPQSGILGMHNIVKRPVAVAGDKVEVHPMMYVALSYDHRVVDGRESVSFLVRLKEYLEDPARLMLEI